MSTHYPRTLTLTDGTTWPAAEPTTTLASGTSWRLRYRPADTLSPGDLNHAADVLDAYSRLCDAPSDQREAILDRLKADLDATSESKSENTTTAHHPEGRP